MTAEVIGLFGPTASGKSAVAHVVAGRLDTEVVSADALQVYRGLPILTNQPEQPTRLVACTPLGESMSVGAYATLAHAAIDELVSTRGAAVVAGGTGLYFRAALAELNLPPPVASGVRVSWERAYDADPAAAHARLEELDAAAAAAVHRNDRRRVVRALELATTGGSLAPDRDRLWSDELRRPTAVFGLHVPTDELERRIERRADAMFEAGVVEEVDAAVRAGVSVTAAQALGLREIVALPVDAAHKQIVVRTRQYAAYQRKWMRRIPGIVLVDGTRPADEVAEEILDAVSLR